MHDLVFSIIATLQVFTEPMTLRPLTNTISTTWSPLMKVYRDAFTRGDIYSASATSVVIAVVTFAVSFGFLRAVSRRAFSEEDRDDHADRLRARPGSRHRHPPGVPPYDRLASRAASRPRCC